MYTIPIFRLEKKQGSEWSCGWLTVPEEVEKLRPEWKPLDSKFRALFTPTKPPWRLLNRALLRDTISTTGGLRLRSFSGWNRACSEKLLPQILPTNLRMILRFRELGLSLNSAADGLESLNWRVTSPLVFSTFAGKNEKFDAVVLGVLSHSNSLCSFAIESPSKCCLNFFFSKKPTCLNFPRIQVIDFFQ